MDYNALMLMESDGDSEDDIEQVAGMVEIIMVGAEHSRTLCVA